MNRHAWKNPAALHARLLRAEDQLRREEATEHCRAVSWLCGLTLAFALSIGCGQPEVAPTSTPTSTASQQTPAPSPPATPSATEPSPLASPQQVPLPRDPMVKPVPNAPRAVYGMPRPNKEGK